VDIHDEDTSIPQGHSFSVRHEAVLSDGRRVVLENDRGWTSWTIRVGDSGETVIAASESDFPTRESIEENARMEVGPDPPMPYKGHTPSESEVAEAHWRGLASILRSRGVEVESSDLSALPHDIEFSDRLRARLGES
jgi:hypothetical protein